MREVGTAYIDETLSVGYEHRLTAAYIYRWSIVFFFVVVDAAVINYLTHVVTL